MLTIWGRSNSLNVQKVMWCIGELSIPHRRLDIGGQFGGNDTPEYRAMNPNGRVPLLQEESGFTLWESNSIVRYLGAKYGADALWPTDPEKRASSERWMDWSITTLSPPIITMLVGLTRTAPESRDSAAIEAARLKCEQSWKIADAQLEGRSFLCGDQLTVGDITIGPWFYRWTNLKIEHPLFRTWTLI